MHIDQLKPHPWDDRRELIILGNQTKMLAFAVDHFIAVCKSAISDHGSFFVALSGGSTPKTIFERLCSPPYKDEVDWSKLFLFWSDERPVPPDHPESNYHMAMESGFKAMPIPQQQIFRMPAEEDIEKKAKRYEETIKTALGGRPFDLIMLGMGEDGHTASLFPDTVGLGVDDRLVIANFLPKQKTWRMTMTFPCINSALHIVFYVMGPSKKEMLSEVLGSSSQLLPAQRVGTSSHKALWIVDEAAALLLKQKEK